MILSGEASLEMYRVHAFAELAGVTVRALHHYDRLGLLKPRRSEAGYRIYAARDLEGLEQILALRFLGLPLKQIRTILERPPLQLLTDLRIQREAIEQKRAHLDRAIWVLKAAEATLEDGRSADPATLRGIIKVIDKEKTLEAMKQYYSDEAWERHRHYYEEGPSPEWQALYRDVISILDQDPAGDAAQAAAERWLALSIRARAGDPDVQTDSPTAWIARERWPPAMKRRIEEYRLQEVRRFVERAATAARKKYFGDAAWERHQLNLTSLGTERSSALWQARVDLFRDVENSLADLQSETRIKLAERWLNHLRAASADDAEVLAGMLRMWADWRNWSTLIRYGAEGMSMMAGERFDRVMDFLDAREV